MKLIVVSMDALIYEDLDALLEKPTFRELFARGAKVDRLRTIYPALTYPCHTTMVTGCLPHRHGVSNNTEERFSEAGLPWLFQHENVTCPDLFDACHRAGLTTAAVGWPVTGCHPSIHWLLDECWPEKGAPVEKFKAKILETGTSPALYQEIIAPLMHLRVQRKSPDSSFFNTGVACGIIRRYQPDLLMLHTGNLDDYRHQKGVFSPLIDKGLDECEQMLAMLVQAAKDAGIWEQTNIVITSDHGHLDVDRTLHLNALFTQKGISSAWCYPMCMSAKVEVKDSKDEAMVRALLETIPGIERIFTREEAKKEGLDGNFTFLLEGDGHTDFDGHWDCPVLTQTPLRGNHGYHPDKGRYCPTLLAFGPGFRENVRLERANLTDTAPTYAALFGLTLPDAEGQPKQCGISGG